MNSKDPPITGPQPSRPGDAGPTASPGEAEIEKKHPDADVASHDTLSEKALRVSELSYRRLFEAAKDGILILDAATGRITDVNPFLFKLLGFSRDEMLGKTVGEAQMRAYQGVDRIRWADGFCRRDIGYLAVEREAASGS